MSLGCKIEYKVSLQCIISNQKFVSLTSSTDLCMRKQRMYRNNVAKILREECEPPTQYKIPGNILYFNPLFSHPLKTSPENIPSLLNIHSLDI